MTYSDDCGMSRLDQTQLVNWAPCSQFTMFSDHTQHKQFQESIPRMPISHYYFEWGNGLSW